VFERDPEELGPEHPDDLEMRQDLAASIHTYTPGPDGRCTERLVRHGQEGAVCGSRDKWSVLHDDPDAYQREAHWHGGGDCMCFELDA